MGFGHFGVRTCVCFRNWVFGYLGTRVCWYVGRRVFVYLGIGYEATLDFEIFDLLHPGVQKCFWYLG